MEWLIGKGENMWWTIIWNYIKNPKNIAITLLVVAVGLLCIYALGQYIALGVKDVKLGKIEAQLKTKDAMIDALTTENNQYKVSIDQVKIQVEKEKILRKQAQKIQASIKEGMTDEEVVSSYNSIVDLSNGVLSDSDSN
jgi:predicted RND superfamily exporter protein